MRRLVRFLLLACSAAALPSPARRVVPTRAALNTVQAVRARCARCARPAEVCVCGALPARIATATRVLVLQHPAEAKRKVATVPLIRATLAPESIEVVTGQCFNLDGLPTLRAALEEGYTPLLLYRSMASRRRPAAARCC